jgi:hypothetical protein
MGGKALKTAKTRRYDKAEFEKIAAYLVPLFREFLHCKIDVVRCYSGKESHGDIDIMIEWDDKNPEDLENKFKTVCELITPDEIFRNTTVISMNFEELQVDLMFIPKENYDVCWHFFAYNDLGGFMGKIARSMKLQYGQDGLKFQIHSVDKSRKLDTVFISRDPKKIIEFLGFNYYEFVRGFNTKEEIFEFVGRSRYYRWATFDGTELNSSQKSRDMGRPMYQELLEHVRGWDDKIKERPSLNLVYDRVKATFGVDLEGHAAFCRAEDMMKLKARAKFNGKVIMEHFKYEAGKEFGMKMAKWTKHVTDMSGAEYILKHTNSYLLREFQFVINR